MAFRLVCVRDMVTRAGGLAIGLAALALAWLDGAALADPIAVSDMRFGRHGDVTRIVLETSERFEPKPFLLTEPRRVVVDMPAAEWLGPRRIDGKGAVKGYRHGLFAQNVYRMVFDLDRPVVVDRVFHLPPRDGSGKRVVIDLRNSSAAAFEKAVAETRSNQPSRSEISRASVPQSTRERKPGGRRIVVVDAGHGGVDPGTLGALGVNEKVVVLRIARVIEDRLESTGRYDVRLTRDRDIFLPLRKRMQVARRHQADLFISVHADALDNPNVRGGTVYTLSESASDREAARLAAKENRSDLFAGLRLDVADDDVSGILIDLAQRETMNYSAQFAEMLLPEMRQQVKMHSRGHRFAGFVVLKSPEIPSVLLETGYLSNRQDARMLNSDSGRKRIALAVRRAVDRYFQHMTALGR
ncbi:N-acetylmuramoyl-L-alanine amidase [Yunchengibacter salinarum]|uniref:N-acetylmuramoyl-L-alanine amidase n=1 Tax=Yunchengibacter salinarum TaxID=3133399 RepID=UPI0035B60524